jgi:hypothetical protein
MNSTEKEVLLKKTLLEVLSDCAGFLVPEPSVISQATLLMISGIGATEIRAKLHNLESDGYIAGVVPDLGGPVKWKITPEGKLALAEVQ